ncbi:MAG: hypothetical protein ACXAEU_23235 [Candidatus Hodarchaeales archaeon]
MIIKESNSTNNSEIKSKSSAKSIHILAEFYDCKNSNYPVDKANSLYRSIIGIYQPTTIETATLRRG